VETDTIVTAATPVEVESDAVEIIRFIFPDTDTSSGTTRFLSAPAQLLTDFAYVTSTVAVQFDGAVPSGRTGYLTYKRKFSRPTAETDNLTTTFLVDEAWERIVAVGAAADAVVGRDIDLATPDFITETAAAEAFPLGSAEKLRISLLRHYAYLINQAQRDLRHRYPIGTEIVDVGTYEG